MTLVYLDACAVIDAREKQSPEAQAVINLIARCAGDETPILTSELTLLEVLVQPIRHIKDVDPIAQVAYWQDIHGWYIDHLSTDSLLIRTVPISRDVLRQAALMRARVPSLRTPDAIHVATAYKAGCTHFVTGDPRLVRGIEADNAWRTATNKFAFVPLNVNALDALHSEAM